MHELSSEKFLCRVTKAVIAFFYIQHLEKLAGYFLQHNQVQHLEYPSLFRLLKFHILLNVDKRLLIVLLLTPRASEMSEIFRA